MVYGEGKNYLVALIVSSKEFTGEKECHFFDAASPIITGESIDFSTAFRASRYDKGDADYVNCPIFYQSYHQEYLE